MKWARLLYAATFGVLNRCGQDSVAIAKIRAAEYYLKLIKMLRNQTLAGVLTIVSAFAVTNLLTIVEVAILLYSPWSVAAKVASAVAVGALGFGITLAAIFRALSQERWMALTGADQIFVEAMES